MIFCISDTRILRPKLKTKDLYHPLMYKVSYLMSRSVHNCPTTECLSAELSATNTPDHAPRESPESYERLKAAQEHFVWGICFCIDSIQA